MIPRCRCRSAPTSAHRACAGPAPFDEASERPPQPHTLRFTSALSQAGSLGIDRHGDGTPLPHGPRPAGRPSAAARPLAIRPATPVEAGCFWTGQAPARAGPRLQGQGSLEGERPGPGGEAERPWGPQQAARARAGAGRRLLQRRREGEGERKGPAETEREPESEWGQGAGGPPGERKRQWAGEAGEPRVWRVQAAVAPKDGGGRCWRGCGCGCGGGCAVEAAGEHVCWTGQGRPCRRRVPWWWWVWRWWIWWRRRRLFGEVRSLFQESLWIDRVLIMFCVAAGSREKPVRLLFGRRLPNAQPG